MKIEPTNTSVGVASEFYASVCDSSCYGIREYRRSNHGESFFEEIDRASDAECTAVLLYGTHDVPQFQTNNALFKFLTPIMAGSGTAERGRINFVGVKAGTYTLVAFKKTWDDQRSFIAERRSYEIEVFDDGTLKVDFEF